MKTILMVFQSVPEQLSLFLFNEVEHDLDLVLRCHGCYINSVDADKYPQDVQDFLVKLSDDQESPVYQDGGEVVAAPDCLVVVCGFFL